MKGHKTIGADYDLQYVSLRFNSAPEHSIKLNYHSGEWGPSHEHTDLRFHGISLNDNNGKH